MNTKDVLFCVGSAGKYHRERGTQHFQRQRQESTFQQEPKDKAGYSAGHDVSGDCSPDSRRPEGRRRSSVLFHWHRGGTRSISRKRSNKIPALLWEDDLGRCVKERLGET